MGATTAISWADKTFNPWIGCTKVSPACDGCYAEAMMDRRYHRAVWGGPGKGVGTRSRTSPSNWRQPLAWNRAAAKAGTRPFVFCASLADVFDNAVPAEWRRDLFDLIRSTPHLVWLLLTKRPQNIVKMVKEIGFAPGNIAYGTTVEDRARVKANMPWLTLAGGLRPLFLFISCEPLLEDLGDLSPWLQPPGNPLRDLRDDPKVGHLCQPVGWVIAGGETDQGDHKARPSHPQWFRSLRDQAVAAGVAYHHKQNGEWCADDGTGGLARLDDFIGKEEAFSDTGEPVSKIGKARAGRLLDGRTWDERPAVPVLSLANAEPAA